MVGGLVVLEVATGMIRVVGVADLLVERFTGDLGLDVAEVSFGSTGVLALILDVVVVKRGLPE